MVKETEQVKGWKSYRFNYGRPVDRFVDEVPEEYSQDIYHEEKTAPGCFVRVVDFEALDQQ